MSIDRSRSRLELPPLSVSGGCKDVLFGCLYSVLVDESERVRRSPLVGSSCLSKTKLEVKSLL